MQVVTERGTVLRGDSAFLVLQPGRDGCQLGPFSALESGPAGRLFDAALAAVPSGGKLFLDAPLANRAATRMYRRAGLVSSGSAELMYAGMKPDYRPEMLFGLATMGSCG